MGFALALLLQMARRNAPAVYATGALDRGTTLGGVTVKQAAIAASVDARDGLPGTAHVFLPAETLDGQTTAHEISGVREWPEELIGGDGTSPLVVRIPIAEGTPETNIIVVLARRVLRFGGLSLRDEVRAVMDKAPREERLNAALAFLARRAPGHLVYRLATAGDEERCRE